MPYKNNNELKYSEKHLRRKASLGYDIIDWVGNVSRESPAQAIEMLRVGGWVDADLYGRFSSSSKGLILDGGSSSFSSVQWRMRPWV